MDKKNIFIFSIIIAIILIVILLFEYFNRDKVIELFSNNNKIIYPISFAINESLFMSPNIRNKKYEIAPMIPGKSETYIYNNEKDYYKQYNQSKFGITKTKAGHDCLRHYEIIASGAVPYFEDIDKIPKNTMHNFPKKLIKEIMDKKDKDLLSKKEYFNYIFKLQNYARKNLTTKALGKYFLDRINYKKNNNILVFSKPHETAKVDYQRDSLSIGLIENMNIKNLDFYENPDWLFNNYNDCSSIYGKGFTICGKLDKRFNKPISKQQIIKNIKSNKYSSIVLTTSSNFSELDKDVYKTLKNTNSELSLVIGNDDYNFTKENIINYINTQYPEISNKIKYVFCRELKDM